MSRPVSYQRDLALDRLVGIVLDVGHKYRLSGPQMWEIHRHLVAVEEGKHEQHLRQIAVGLAKQCSGAISQ